MRILWTLPYLPWPTTSGGKTRQYHLLRSLAARGHRITLLVQSKTALDDAARAALEPLLERLIVLPRRPLRHPATMAAALFAPWPLLASVNGMGRQLQDTFERLLEESWDVIQIEHSYGFQPFARLLAGSRRPFLLTEHNVESSLGAATYDRLPGWLKPFVLFDQWRYRRWERRVMGMASQVVAVTPEDAGRFAALTGSPVSVVVNGVDTRAFAQVRPDFSEQRILFVGNYEYAPNLDAVEWALDEILPRLWHRCPQARFAVCGYALPAEWAQRWPDPRIEWLGFVPDLSTVQARSAVFLAPLRHGGGSKLKVLEALAAGLPLVSTAQGASGLKLEDRVHCRLAEQPEALAMALADLLQKPAEAARLGEAGRDYARREHDWQAAAEQLEQAYRALPRQDEVPACA